MHPGTIQALHYGPSIILDDLIALVGRTDSSVGFESRFSTGDSVYANLIV